MVRHPNTNSPTIIKLNIGLKFMVLFLLTSGQSPIFLILIPNSGATLSGAGNRWFSVEVIILIILGPLTGYGQNLWSKCSSGRWFGPAFVLCFTQRVLNPQSSSPCPCMVSVVHKVGTTHCSSYQGPPGSSCLLFLLIPLQPFASWYKFMSFHQLNLTMPPSFVEPMLRLAIKTQ